MTGTRLSKEIRRVASRARRSSAGAVLALAAVCGVLLAVVSPATFAQSLEISVDRSVASVDDHVLVRVTVRGVRNVRPTLPDVDGIRLQPRGQSSQMSFVNGKVDERVTYNYVLLPESPGTYTLGPATLQVGNREIRSKTVRVRIEREASPGAADKDLFVTAKVSVTEPWVGQQVAYVWRLYRRVRIAGADLEPLEFPGFLVESLGDVKEYETTVNGVKYAVSEIRKALFPLEKGTLTIPAASLTCDVVMQSSRRSGSLFDDFFGRTQTKRRKLRTRAIKIEVKPLPPAPAGFSGLVGQFDLEAKVARNELKVGESATLEIDVYGTGNVGLIAEPPLPELASFKIYDDKPSSSVNRSGKVLSGRKSFRKALVPVAPGRLEVPAIRLTYFDPDAGRYRTDDTNAIAMTIAPADGQEELRLTESIAPTTGKVAVRILADDILPIHRGGRFVPSRRGDPVAAAGWLGGFVAPPIGFFAVLLLRRRARRFERDASLKRRRRALKSARSVLRSARGDADAGRHAEAAGSALRCVRGFVGDKLDLEGTALTALEIDEQLARRGVDGPLARSVRDLLERLEAGQYAAGTAAAAPASDDGARPKGAYLDDIEPLLKQLDGALR